MFYKNFRELLVLELSSLCHRSNDLSILIRNLKTYEEFKDNFPIKEVRRLYTEVKEPLTKTVLLASIEYYFKGYVQESDKLSTKVVKHLKSKSFNYESLNREYYEDRSIEVTPGVQALTYKLYKDLQYCDVFNKLCLDLKSNQFNFFEVYPKYKYWLGQGAMFYFSNENTNLFYNIFIEANLEMPCWINVTLKRLQELK